MLTFRSPLELTAAVEAARKAEQPTASRSEMIRSIVTDWLRSRGYLNE